MENQNDLSKKFRDALLSAAELCMTNSEESLCEKSESDSIVSYLQDDMTKIQEFLSRKRRLHFGNDILNYLRDPSLTKPEYVATPETCVDSEAERLRRIRKDRIAKLQTQAKEVREVATLQIQTRRGQVWHPKQVDPQQVLVIKAHSKLVEPLRVERESLLKTTEEHEAKQQEWDSKVKQVEPYLEEVSTYGEPRHKIHSQFWVNILGEEEFEKNIKATLYPTFTNTEELEENTNSGDNIMKHISDVSTVEQVKNETKPFAKQSEVEVRKKKLRHPKKPNLREKLIERFNNPRIPPPVRKVREPPQELTDLEKKQLQAQKQHKHEREKAKIYHHKNPRPGKFNDTSKLVIIKPKIDVDSENEDKEFDLFVNRFIAHRQKQIVNNYKWRNITHPLPPKRGLGLKIFPGFHPQSNNSYQ